MWNVYFELDVKATAMFSYKFFLKFNAWDLLGVDGW